MVHEDCHVPRGYGVRLLLVPGVDDNIVDGGEVGVIDVGPGFMYMPNYGRAQSALVGGVNIAGDISHQAVEDCLTAAYVACHVVGQQKVLGLPVTLHLVVMGG